MGNNITETFTDTLPLDELEKELHIQLLKNKKYNRHNYKAQNILTKVHYFVHQL